MAPARARDAEGTGNDNTLLDLHCDRRLRCQAGSMPRLSVLALALVAAFMPACAKDAPNPFADQTRTALPPPNTDVAFTANGWAPEAGAGRELFAVSLDGSGLTRLTFCNDAQRPCDIVQAAFSPERGRMAALRRFSADEPPALVYFDLSRSTSLELVPASGRVSGVDWSPAFDVLAYSGAGQGGVDDLFRTDVARPTPDNQQNTADLTSCVVNDTPIAACDPTIAESHPRINRTGEVAVFERIPAGGKAEIFLFNSPTSQVRVAPAGPGTDPLPGSPYIVGADADPAFSPDGQSVVFRRLTAPGTAGVGNWDILTIGLDGTGLQVLASGAAFRGAPDWGSRGIVFPEIDPLTGQPSLVSIQPDGSGRRAVLTLGAGYVLSNPRWLR